MSNLSLVSLLPMPISGCSFSSSSLSSPLSGSSSGVEGEGLETFLVGEGAIRIGAGKAFFLVGF